MIFVENVIPALARHIDEGRKVALVTLVNVEGSSPRPLGSQIGVAENGDYVGMLTGGCAEKAIVAEALECIKRAENKLVRYGDGSPYLDVVLPCGSGIDLFFDVLTAEAITKQVLDSHNMRKPAHLRVNLDALSASLADAPSDTQTRNIFTAAYPPNYRIAVFGEGANLISFATIAKQSGFDVSAYSPDGDALRFLSDRDIDTQDIHREFDFSSIAIDPFTAIVTLFHEHEWEAPILRTALNSDADYIGALGSRRTHSQRLETLAALDKTERLASDIHGPVGLDIGAANPNEIALSILAEIIAHRRQGVR